MPFTAITPATATAIDFGTLGAPAAAGGMTLAQLREELRSQLGNRQDVLPARLDLWINFAYTDLWTSLPLEEQKASVGFSTVAEQPFYLLSDVVGSIEEVAVSQTTHPAGGWSLRKIDLGAWRRMAVADPAEPSEFFRHNSVLVLDAAPDEVYDVTLDFRLLPAFLEADGDVPLLSRQWHEGIILMAKAKAEHALGEEQRALVADNAAVGFVRRRSDTTSEEDRGRIVGSSVPGRGRDLTRRSSTFPRDD